MAARENPDQKERDRSAVASFGLAVGAAIKGRQDVGDVERVLPSPQDRGGGDRPRTIAQHAKEKATASSW